MSDNVIKMQFRKKVGVDSDGTVVNRQLIDSTEEAIAYYSEWLLKRPLGDILAQAFSQTFAGAPVCIWAALRASWDGVKYVSDFASNYMGSTGRVVGEWHTALTISPVEGEPADIRPAYRAVLFAGLEEYLGRFDASAEMQKGTDPWTRLFVTVFNLAERMGHVIPKLIEEGDSLVCLVGVLNTVPDQPRLWYKITYTLNGAAKDFQEYNDLANVLATEG